VLENPLLLDCGSTTNLLCLHTAEVVGARLETASNVRLYNASGERMTVGQSEILVMIPGMAG
jgi:hypothetical protein